MINSIKRDGHLKLNHNRLLAGTYPIEDIRLSDLDIKYIDSNREEITGNKSLSEYGNIDIEITSDSAFIEETSVIQLNFDTSKLDTNIVISTAKSMPIGLITGVLAGLLILISVITIVILIKKKKS